MAMRMSRRLSWGSKPARWISAASEKATNWRTSSASDRAVEVGVTPVEVFRNRSSRKCSRSLASAWLTALWLTPSDLAERDTLPVRSRLSKIRNRFRSTWRYRMGFALAARSSHTSLHAAAL